jgi:hypothetical protein
LSVGGASKLTGDAVFGGSISVSGATILASTLSVSGASKLTGNAVFGGSISISGATTMASTLSVGGASKLTGDAVFGGSISISGSATLASTLSVSAAATFNSTTNTVGSATFGSNVNVTGDTILSSTLSVTGVTTLKGTTNAFGAVNISNALTVSGNTALGSSLSVHGAIYGATNLTVDGTATLNGNVIVGNNEDPDDLIVHSRATFEDIIVGNSTVTLNSTLSVSGLTTLGNVSASAISTGSLHTSGTATFGSTLSVSGNTHFATTVHANGAATFGSTVSISGITNGSRLILNGVDASTVSTANVYPGEVAGGVPTLQVSGLTKFVDSPIVWVEGASSKVFIDGDLIVKGNVTNIETQNVVVKDPVLFLNSMADTAVPQNVGFVAKYATGSSTYANTGLVRISSTVTATGASSRDTSYYVFADYAAEGIDASANNSVFTSSSFDQPNLSTANTANMADVWMRKIIAEDAAFSDLTLTNALPVTQGGTGATSFSSGKIVIGGATLSVFSGTSGELAAFNASGEVISRELKPSDVNTFGYVAAGNGALYTDETETTEITAGKIGGSGLNSLSMMVHGPVSSESPLTVYQSSAVDGTTVKSIIRFGSGNGNGNALQAGSGAPLVIDSATGFVRAATSSRRYKKEIQDITEEHAAKIQNVRTVQYRYKENNSLAYGVIAEELEEQGLTDAVMYNKEGQADAVDYQMLYIMMLKEMQTMRKELNELKTKCKC